MSIQKSRPFYKSFLKIQRNIQDKQKLFKFKRKKWGKLQAQARKELSYPKRFSLRDLHQSPVPRFVSRGNVFKRKFKSNLTDRTAFSLFYGGIHKKYLKKVLRSSRLVKSLTDIFEKRLDTILYRAKLASSIKMARQLVFHGHITLNSVVQTSKNYLVKNGDIIGVSKNQKVRTLVMKNIDSSNFWPIPPKHLLVNYATLNIVFLQSKKEALLVFSHHPLNTRSIVDNSRSF